MIQKNKRWVWAQGMFCEIIAINYVLQSMGMTLQQHNILINKKYLSAYSKYYLCYVFLMSGYMAILKSLVCKGADTCPWSRL